MRDKQIALCAGCGKEINEEKFAIVGVGEDLCFWHHPCYNKDHDQAGNYTGNLKPTEPAEGFDEKYWIENPPPWPLNGSVGEKK